MIFTSQILANAAQAWIVSQQILSQLGNIWSSPQTRARKAVTFETIIAIDCHPPIGAGMLVDIGRATACHSLEY